jgi:branched-chain amino acid transport system ATP-binding protein
MSLLEVKNLSKSFGGLRAVSDIEFSIQHGEIIGLIGPNGAGKTTIFNLISGVYSPDTGRVIFQSRDINHLRADRICKLGLTRTFQITKPFLKLTVLENVMVGAYNHTHNREVAARQAREMLEATGLGHRANFLASTLTLEERKRLELIRALATRPVLLLLDEVMAGLNSTEVDEMIVLLRKIRDGGVTLFIIEHVMRALMQISDQIIVIHHGENIASGQPKEVAKNQQVIEAYLGEEYVLDEH